MKHLIFTKVRFLIFNLGIVLTISISLLSCGRSTLYQKYIKVNDAWSKNDPLFFDVAVSDTTMGYDFYVNLRHNNEYRYQNLYVFFETKFPNQHITRDTLEFMLADPSGKWLGKGWGKMKEDQILLKQKLRFPLKGNYQFTIWQGMRTDTLIGIVDVGIQIEKEK